MHTLTHKHKQTYTRKHTDINTNTQTLRYFFCQTCFKMAFQLFTLFDTFHLKDQLETPFNMSKKNNVLG